jgi:putative transposase
MLTQEKLSDLCRRHRLGDFAIATVLNIRKSDPSRIVRSGTHNVVTHYASRKMGCVIKAEASRTELAAIYEWDHDKNTYEFYDQPPAIKKIHVRDNGKTTSHLYTPDFFRLADDFIGWVECKAEDWLKKQEALPFAHYVRDSQGSWRCPSAERYAQSVGLEFAVRSSSESDPITTQNIADLSDYYREDCPVPSKAQLALARQFMGTQGWCWLRDLLANDQGLSADTIYKLIADEELHVDLQPFPLMKEPHRVRVYATRALMGSSELWLPAMLATPDIAIQQVEPIAGEALLWDGNACEVLNVGETEIFLRMGGGALQNLPLMDFERLVCSSAIVATRSVVNPHAVAAAEVLRQSSAEDVKSAMHRYYCIHPELCPPDEVHESGDRAIRKWKAMARRGYVEYGNEFIGLLPTIHKRGNRNRKLKAPTLEIMHRFIEDEVMSEVAPGLFTCWAQVCDACNQNGLVFPSYKSFLAEIKKLKTPEVLKKAREGEKAGYDLELPFISLDRETPKHGTRPFEIAHIDHTVLDLQFVTEGTGVPMGKACLTVMIDAFTRKILAWVITFDEPSYRSCMLVIRDCIRRYGRMPKTIVVDQGSEFKGTYFEQLLAYLGVHKRMRPASHPRFGNIVERFFGLQNTAFTHALRGNNKALQNPRRMSPTHDPRDLAVWNLRAFREAFEGFLTEYYHAVEHPMLGISPTKAMEIGLLQSGTRAHTLIAYDRNFLIATMPTTDKGTSKVQRDGSFKANREDYFAAGLVEYVGQNLPVRYDPFDLSRALVMGRSGWIEACSLHAHDLTGRTEKEIEAISLEINAINARAGIRQKERGLALGAYLRSVRGREAILRVEVQQARDRELRAADADIGLLGSAPTYAANTLAVEQQPVQSLGTADSTFEYISQETYEDF